MKRTTEQMKKSPESDGQNKIKIDALQEYLQQLSHAGVDGSTRIVTCVSVRSRQELSGEVRKYDGGYDSPWMRIAACITLESHCLLPVSTIVADLFEHQTPNTSLPYSPNPPTHVWASQFTNLVQFESGPRLDSPIES